MLTAGELVHAAAVIFLAGAILGCAYLLIAAVLVTGFEHSGSAAPTTPVPVSVLVPLCGGEPELASRLAALCRQDYAAPIQIVCGLQSENDPALHAVTAAAADASHGAIECYVEPRQHGRNRKVSNLINMVRYARHEALILVDSDVEVTPNFVAEMVGMLQRPGVGAVTCLFHGMALGGLWARLSALRINAHFLPNVIVALSTKLAQPCFGVGIAITRETLRSIGGFHAFADRLWEDYAIGEAVRGLGATVVMPSFALGHVFAERSAGELVAAELRAARIVRSIDPQGHAGSFITHPLALALIAAGLGAGSPAIAVALLAFACRVLVCRSIEQRFDADAMSYLLLLPLRDLLSFAIQVASYFGSTVTWRGERYRLTDRRLIPG
jgi:ceramide glucosyltransferase